MHVKINAPPQIVSTPVTNAIVGYEYAYDVQAIDPDDPDLAHSLAIAPADMTIDAQTGQVTWTPTPAQAGEHHVTISVRDALLAEDSQQYTLTVYEDESADLWPPEVVVTAEPGVVDPGEPVTITVTATDDFAVASVELTVNDAPVALDPHNQAVYTPADSGGYVAVATAIDQVGHTGSAATDFYARVPGDGIPPTVNITSPELDAEVKVPTEIIGTASDDNLFKYTLAYRPIGEGEFVEFAVGYESVVDDVLGTLDPTLMMNGIHEVRLRAEDTNGNFDEVIRTYSIAGNMKVGNFTVSFIDLQVPVSGIPLTVTRTYDSRSKTSGDFGFGWTLDVASAKIEENSTLGHDWEQIVVGHFISTYILRPLRAHIVSFTLPDGRVERFQALPVPSQSVLWPIQYITGIQFQAIYPTTSTLTATGGLPDFYDGDIPGTGTLIHVDEGLPADPVSYELTLADGTVLAFVGDWNSRTAKLQRITDLNDNTLQIMPNGITHSSGKDITIDRDERGRVTSITDPNGDQIVYEYDEQGDLVSVTDQDGKVTTFLYDLNHYLIEIISPDGQQVARNIYDDEGWLIAVLDSDGNRREIEHDSDNRVEVVRDALGNPTIYEYDQSGNVAAETDALGNRTDYTYEDRGNQLTKTDALGNTTTWTYDAHNNKLSETDPLGNTRHWTYNARNQLTSELDALGNTTAHAYDANGNLTASTDPLGGITTRTYNTWGSLASRADPLGNVTVYAYDQAGNRIQKIDPLGQVTIWTCDSNGNQLTETQTRTTAAGPVAMTTVREYN